MNIGVLKEIKIGESRVGLTPEGVRRILESGSGNHSIFVEQHAGELSGFSNAEYLNAGAKILSTAKEVYKNSTLIMHVKEPLPKEYSLLRADHILFTYLHLAAAPELTKKLMSIGLTGLAYETLEDEHHNLPLLAPMSKIAGKIAFIYGLNLQQKMLGGKGLYVGAIDGKAMGHCVVVGGGILGFNAAESFIGIGANVTIIENNPEKRKTLKQQFPTATVLTPDLLNTVILDADIVIGAALVPGGRAPILISKQQIDKMKPGTVIIDLAIDQGGTTELSRPTSVENPTFIYNKVIFCCVPNIPAVFPQTSTRLLTTATLPYVIALANQGLEILHSNHSFQTALNLYQGACTNKAVAEAVNVPYRSFASISKK